MIRLAICFPTMGNVDAGTTVDLATMGLYLGNRAAKLGISEVMVHQMHLTYLPVAREELALQALGHGATHLLWVDSDMRFEIDVVERLLAHDLPIVGCNYRRRGIGNLSSAVRLGDNMPLTARNKGLEPVSHMGMGMCLIKAEVFSKVSRPWFEAGYRDGRFLGEDFVFFTKARGAGYEVVVDHELSQGMGHVWHQEMRLEVQKFEHEPPPLRAGGDGVVIDPDDEDEL